MLKFANRPSINKFNKATKAIAFSITIFLSAYIIAGYLKSTEPSKFHLACLELNFKPINVGSKIIQVEDQEEALLTIFYLAGYLTPERLWQDINEIKLSNPTLIFNNIMPALIQSGATQSDPSKFNAKLLRKNFLKTIDIATNDICDLILYIAQHDYNRVKGQERNELKVLPWMNEHKEAYLEQASKLGMIKRIEPNYQIYDAAWIAGASRGPLMSRVVDYLSLTEKGIKINGDSFVLSGDRPLWAEIDGVLPLYKEKILETFINGLNIDDLDVLLRTENNPLRTNEGKKYLTSLAIKNDIKLNPTQPFIVYTPENCPAGFYPGRHYPNYATSSEKKLTEKIMASDVLNNLAKVIKFEILNTPAATTGERPSTATTAKDAAEIFIKNIITQKYGNKKEFHILFQSNNPYIERQKLAAQTEVDKILLSNGLSDKGYNIIIDAVGFTSKQGVSTVHSELALLIAEKYKYSKIKSDRNFRDLLFESQNKNIYSGPLPALINPLKSNNIAQELFDEWLN